MFKEMTDAELLDFCEDNFCEYKVCQALGCGDDCKDEDCPLVQLFDRFKKSAVIVPDTNVGCKSEWISVAERLPESLQRVLAINTRGDMFTSVYISFSTGKNAWSTPYSYLGYITHWMPLPEPPDMKGGAE